ncbi:hypothetical protein IJI69_01130 [Candidatus Saccharibacteria bacterium]|nr:hypothetical protein [Candidatus Saccharibacteria bacterium]
MDQFAQTNDLQKAIDNIAGGGSAVNTDAQFGIPPMPPMPENGNELPAVEPLVPAENSTPSAEEILSQSITSGDMPPVVDNVEAPAAEAPAAESVAEPAMPETTETVEAPAEDLNDVKQNILKDLLPLLDKTEKTPEEKFEIYKDAIATMHDVKTIEGAYKAASGIADETARANALLDLMKAIG